MPKTAIEEQLDHEINWRTNEISIVKTVPFLYTFSDQQKDVLKKHTIPIFYSLWEGFAVESFSIYTREINKLKLLKHQICISLLVHSIDIKYNLKSTRTDFEKQTTFIKDISTHLEGCIEIPINVPTESNVNFKVINGLLRRFNLGTIPEDPYKKNLDKLLFFRNKLSHGEYSIPIDQPTIDEMSIIAISSMHELANKITEGFHNKSYLAPVPC